MAERTSRWARRYVVASAIALVCWQIGILFEVPRRTEVALGVFGFVFHVIFGKAYALVPSYFDSQLRFPRAPGVQFPLVFGGATGLAFASLGVGPPWLAPGSAILWGLGIAVFVGTLLATVGTPLLEGETGTGDHNVDRVPVDRLANRFVPVAMLYLLAGSYETAAVYSSLPPLFGGVSAQASHLLAAGTAALLVFSLGFRLLPRFLGTHPPLWTARVVLPTAAAGPAFIAAGFATPAYQMVGAVLEAVAVCVFALVVLRMVVRSDRVRVGLYGVAAAMVSGVAGVFLGVAFAFDIGFDTALGSLLRLHFRLNVLGFLGLTIVGLTYQFYPPSIGDLPGSSDRTALLSILGIVLALLFHAAAIVGDVSGLVVAGSLLGVASAIGFLYLVGSALLTGS